jgi:hypothetical protein
MVSGFLLCILSPVWRAKLCGEIGNQSRQSLEVEEGEAMVFSQLLALGCGDMVRIVGGLQALLELGIIADRYQVETVQDVVEKAILSHLTVENCASIVSMSCESGLEKVKCASRELALSEFDAFALSAGFMELGEDLLGTLLDDDALRSKNEESVFEMVVRWMRRGGADGAVRGVGLLRKIRFPFMAATYLENNTKEQLRVHELDALITEALALKEMDCLPWWCLRLKHLEATALTPRRSGGQVSWGRYVEGGEFRLPTGQWVACVAPHGSNWVCAGWQDGSIRVWSRSTLGAQTTFIGHTSCVRALLSVGEMLISGSDDCCIRVWDMKWVVTARGRCMRVLRDHTDGVTCLAVSGRRLVSGSSDGTVRVWMIEGPASQWRCERMLYEHESGYQITSLAVWGDRLASGSAETTILVWDLESGAHEQALVGHTGSVTGSVTAIVISGQRLISSSTDKTVKVWSTATWACVLTVQAYAAESVQYITRLAVSGSTLVGGSDSLSRSALEEYEVRVWNLETLEPLHTLKQPAGRRVKGLTRDGGEVWVACGQEVVVWGWRGKYCAVGPEEIHQWVDKLELLLLRLSKSLWQKLSGGDRL